MRWAHAAAGTPLEAWTSHHRWAGVPLLELPSEVERVVVLAAHPDDESLGAGGLLARAARRGLEVVVVVATDGEASHPASPTHPPQRLAAVRRAELRTAVDRVAPGARVEHLGLPDSGLAAAGADGPQDPVTTALVDLVGDGRRTLLVAPWRGDGHPDHEAAGRAAAAAAVRTGAELWEYPVWLWHSGAPDDDAPWDEFAALDLDAEEAAHRAAAQAAHRSQVRALSDRPGDEALLSPGFLRHFAGPRETYVRAAAADPSLDDLHAGSDDPWGVDVRWYEERKRALLLAALPRRRFRHGLEVGGSTGALAAALADRCDDLVVLDASPHAAAAARERSAGRPDVRVEVARVPHEWPDPPAGGFDLVVVSEVGYFLSPRDLDGLVERLRGDLAADGVLVLSHWRHPIEGWPLDGADVHETVVGAGLRPVVARYADRDVELLVLADPGVLPDPDADA